MKVAARDDIAAFQNERIVGGGVGFDAQRVTRVPKLVHAGPNDLRRATETVRILHALVAVTMAVTNGRALQQHAEPIGTLGLSSVAAQFMNAMVEWRTRPHRRVHAQRRGGERRHRQPPGIEQPRQCERRGSLRAVEQRQSFLRLQHQRFQSRQLQRARRRHALALVERLALTDQCGGHVGQWRQIAGRANRSLFRHHGNDVGRRELLQSFHHHRAHAEAPRPSDTHLSASMSRTTRVGSGSPKPALCERTRLRCSVARSASAIRTEASLPKPVFTP